MAVVYTHIRLDSNEVFYVGIGAHKKRAFSRSSRNKYWYHIANKHGFKVVITHDNLIWEEACSIEKYLISFYGKFKDGGSLVNLTDGGDGVFGIKQSEYSKKRSHEVHFGSKRSEEHRRAISQKLKGRVFTKDTLLKMSVSKKGKPAPHISEINKSRFGDKHPMYGKKHKEESIELMSAKAKKRVGQNSSNRKSVIDLITGDIYPTIKEAANAIGISYYSLKHDLYKYSRGRLKLL